MTRGLGARNLDLDLLAAPCACSISYRRGWLRERRLGTSLSALTHVASSRTFLHSLLVLLCQKS
jgi:hypothetical protein